MAIDKITDPAAAASIYANTAKTADHAGISGGDGEKASFSDLIKTSARSAIDSIKGGEKASAQAVTGEANLAEVVQSITEAELTLQTVVAVRDRVISAYQEIMRMPI